MHEALKEQIRVLQNYIWDKERNLRNLERDLRLQLIDKPVDFFQLNVRITVPLELSSRRLSDDEDDSPESAYDSIMSQVIRNIEEGYNDPECPSNGQMAVELLEQKIIKLTHETFNELWGKNHFNTIRNKKSVKEMIE
ncbi:hypothetical protein LCGC14_0195670 [marine sediment metagenome]|uniref:Uncharacterized protein n=1 Tax=marine sediment metagenome TaxID=412755 RepID=A0A0F9UQ11_9ZZZZ